MHASNRILAVMAAIALSGFAHHSARANCYPSSVKIANVTQTGVTVSYVLNENADGDGINPGVTIQVRRASDDALIRTVTFASQLKGEQTYEWDRTDGVNPVPEDNYYFRVITADNGYGAWTQISADSAQNSFFVPTGVDVNRNPDSVFFGRIYVVETTGGATAERTTQDGMYILNADLSDAVGQGSTARKGGIIYLGTNSPFRVAVGPDDRVFQTDWSDGLSAVRVGDPDFVTATEVLDNTNRAGTGLAANHGSISTVFVEGTGAGQVIYTIDEDYDAGIDPAHGGRGSILQYAIGTTALPFTGTPTILYDDGTHGNLQGEIVNYYADHVRASDGTWWVTQNRAGGGTDTFLSVMQVSSDGSTVLWQSVPDLAANSLADPLRRATGIAWDPVNDWLAIATCQPSTPTGNGHVIIFDDDTKSVVHTVLVPGTPSNTTSGNKDVAFDAAGNLYVINNVAERLRVWSPPGGINGFTTESPTFSTGGPSITVQPQDQIVCEGAANVQFSVTASSPGTLSYQWLKNTVPLSNGGHYSGVDTATLVISPVDATDLGTYRVNVTDGNGTTPSAEAVLAFHADPTITQNPTTKVVAAGANVSFSAAATSAVPSPNDGLTYQWMKNDAIISDGPGVSGSTTTTLSLTGVQPVDDGAKFHLVITDTCNQSVSSNPGWLFIESASCSDPFADANADQIVDLNDYGAWQRCYTGPSGAVDPAACSCFDRDGDGDVDDGEDGTSDLDAFLNCASTHPIAADPDCDGPSGGTVLFSDNFDAGTSAANWTKLSTDADNVTDFAFDYSTLGIPSAPNSTGTTVGLLMRVNDTAPAANTAVSLYPNSQNFSGNYRLRFDMYMSYTGGPGGSGVTISTHHLSAGINTTGTQVIWDGVTTTDDGYSVTCTGEGGDTAGYNLYVGKTVQPSGPIYFSGTRNDDNPYYDALFPSPTYETSGSPGKNWVTVEISQVGGVIAWKLNGAPIASKADATFTSGNIMIGYADLYGAGATTPADPQFMIIDNVRVISD